MFVNISQFASVYNILKLLCVSVYQKQFNELIDAAILVAMVQNKDIEEKVLTNGEIKGENSEKEEAYQNGKLNGHESEYEDSDDDDYLDHLLVVPRLDTDLTDRNKNLVLSSLLDFCSAIEGRKEYQKIKQELLANCEPTEGEQEEIQLPVEEKPNLNGKEESPTPEAEPTVNEVTEEEVKRVPELRRQSIRLNKAKFVPEHEPSINDQFFVCRRCTIFFRTRKLRKEHNQQHHRRKFNGQVVGTEKPKQRLRRSSSNKNPFICDWCQKQFKQKALLRSHMNTHLTEPRFFCELCPYASKRNNDLKKHLETHHNPDRIAKGRIRRRKCEKCDEVLPGKKEFKLHMREKHPPSTPVKKIRILKRTCEQCQEVVEGLKALRLHMKLKHSESNEIRCETCHRKFKTNFRLKKHKIKFADTGTDCRTYFKNKATADDPKVSFDCEHCEKKFQLKSHLSLHMKKHANLTCGKCNMTFKNKFNLKWHEFSHLEIEPKCTHCAISFTSEQKFAVHLKKKICNGSPVILNGIIGPRVVS